MKRQKEEHIVARKINKTKMNRIDGGFGWVIVCSAFITLMLVDGVLFTLGILYIEFLDEFKEGKGKTAWITSLIPGTMLTVGMIFLKHDFCVCISLCIFLTYSCKSDKLINMHYKLRVFGRVVIDFINHDTYWFEAVHYKTSDYIFQTTNENRQEIKLWLTGSTPSSIFTQRALIFIIYKSDFLT